MCHWMNNDSIIISIPVTNVNVLYQKNGGFDLDIAVPDPLAFVSTGVVVFAKGITYLTGGIENYMVTVAFFRLRGDEKFKGVIHPYIG